MLNYFRKKLSRRRFSFGRYFETSSFKNKNSFKKHLRVWVTKRTFAFRANSSVEIANFETKSPTCNVIIRFSLSVFIYYLFQTLHLSSVSLSFSLSFVLSFSLLLFLPLSFCSFLQHFFLSVTFLTICLSLCLRSHCFLFLHLP